jgi:uncharacterized protein YutE (UPF0331/DUF86 family)
VTALDPGVVRRKLGIIVGNLDALHPIADLSTDAYRLDLFRRKGTERLLQELIEAALDINAHVLVQEHARPPDDYHEGFALLAQAGVIPRDLAASLAPSAGLRTRLVHEYDDIVDAIVLDAVRKAIQLYPRYVEAIEAYLDRRTA